MSNPTLPQIGGPAAGGSGHVFGVLIADPPAVKKR